MTRWEAKEISRNFVVEWNGKPVKRIKKSFNTARIIAGLDDNVTPHVLRHTAATWLMQNGVDLWEAAGYLGMSVETLERTYGHHHPHYLANARDAIARQNTDSYLRTEDERSFSGVMKKDKFSRKVGWFGTRGSQVQILPLRPGCLPLPDRGGKAPHATASRRRTPTPGRSRKPLPARFLRGQALEGPAARQATFCAKNNGKVNAARKAALSPPLRSARIGAGFDEKTNNSLRPCRRSLPSIAALTSTMALPKRSRRASAASSPTIPAPTPSSAPIPIWSGPARSPSSIRALWTSST